MRIGWSTECWLWCRWLWEECVDPRDASVLICGEKDGSWLRGSENPKSNL